MSDLITYYGWSAISMSLPSGTLYFDPFYRPYCGAEWFARDDFQDARYIAVTHGHEEHFLDVPELARDTGAEVIGPNAVIRFLHKRNKIPQSQLLRADPGNSVALQDGTTIKTFGWKHRDINLWKAMTKAVFTGNTTQISWAWSSATKAPFYSPYTGYFVRRPNGLTVLNYNEGLNSKMTNEEIAKLGRELQPDVVLGGMQLDFVEDVRRGMAALDPKIVLLYPPHEYLHHMMGAQSRPWGEFVEAAQEGAPSAWVVAMAPGDTVDLEARTVSSARATSAAAG